MATTTNPNFPSEIDEIETIMHQYMACRDRGRVDLQAQARWDDTKLDPLFEAIQRLREHMEELYPPVAVKPVYVTEELRETA